MSQGRSLSDVLQVMAVGMAMSQANHTLYQRAIRRLEKWLQRPATSSDLNMDSLCEFTKALVRQGASPATVDWYQTKLCYLKVWSDLDAAKSADSQPDQPAPLPANPNWRRGIARRPLPPQ